MSSIVSSLYLIVFSISILLLISYGLAIIFGLMNVINLAHGEFIMVGAYACALTVRAGLPLLLGFLVAFVVTAVMGFFIERLIIRHLYGRLLDTLLATWGVSLFLVGAITTLFGGSSIPVPVNMPISNVSLFGSNMSTYNLIVCLMAGLILVALYYMLARTRLGLTIRGSMQSVEMATVLGVNVNRTYIITFALGSGLAGLAGGILSPLTGASPAIGSYFVAKAFITVIVGGALPLTGTGLASVAFGVVDGSVSYIYTSVLGEIAILLLAVVLLRLLPEGMTKKSNRAF